MLVKKLFTANAYLPTIDDALKTMSALIAKMKRRVAEGEPPGCSCHTAQPMQTLPYRIHRLC